MQKYWRFLRVKLIRNTKPDADYDFEWVKHEKFTLNQRKKDFEIEFTKAELKDFSLYIVDKYLETI